MSSDAIQNAQYGFLPSMMTLRWTGSDGDHEEDFTDVAKFKARVREIVYPTASDEDWAALEKAIDNRNTGMTMTTTPEGASDGSGAEL